MTRLPKLLRKARAKLSRGTVPERELSAYHESAHVVIAWAQGVEVSRVSLDTGESAEIRDDFAAFTERGFGTWIENARISIAGRIADQDVEEALRADLQFDLGDGVEHNDDASFKMNLYYAAELDVDRARELVEPAWNEAAADLDRHQRQWYRLAEELCRRGAMETDDIARVLGPLPEVNAETRAEREAVMEEIKAGYPALKRRKGVTDGWC